MYIEKYIIEKKEKINFKGKLNNEIEIISSNNKLKRNSKKDIHINQVYILSSEKRREEKRREKTNSRGGAANKNTYR